MYKNLYKYILLDWKQNKKSIKSFFIIYFYRLSSYFSQNKLGIIRFIGIPIRILYKLIVEFIMCIELPDKTVSGPGLGIFHGVGLVVNARTSFGSNVTLRQCTTIGQKQPNGVCPRIGNNVDIGANVVIIGDIDIGENVLIGAGSVVIKSVPANSIVAGNPARVIRKLSKI